MYGPARDSRGRSDCQRLAFRASRGRRFSWVSAAFHGRLTGSGALFGGQDSGSGIEAYAQQVAQNGVTAAAAAINQAAGAAKANAATSSFLSSPVGLGIVAVVVYLVLRKKS